MASFDPHKNHLHQSSISIDKYLDRIGLTKEQPSFSYLKKLHKAHLLKIPFENLDIIFNKKMALDIQKIFEKVIIRKRGGIPLELNVLFFHLLHELGFRCHLVSARAFLGESWGPQLDQPATIVTIENDLFLTDIGSKSLFMVPKKIQPDMLQLDYNQYFRFVKDPDNRFILQISGDGLDFRNVYLFDLAPKELILFMERFKWFQESPESPYAQGKIVFQYTKDGKVLLTDHSIQIVEAGGEINLPILHDDDFASKLKEYFGLDYDQLFHERFDQ